MRRKEDVVLTAWKIWGRILACVLILIVAYGILAPDLLSNSQSDLGVFAGIVVVFGAPMFCLWILFPIYKCLKTKLS